MLDSLEVELKLSARPECYVWTTGSFVLFIDFSSKDLSNFLFLVTTFIVLDNKRVILEVLIDLILTSKERDIFRNKFTSISFTSWSCHFSSSRLQVKRKRKKKICQNLSHAFQSQWKMMSLDLIIVVVEKLFAVVVTFVTLRTKEVRVCSLLFVCFFSSL